MVLLLVPLLLACDRQPVAPDSEAAPSLGAATAEWIPWDIEFPPEGLDFGIISCLGQQAQAYGGVSGRSRWVTRSDGSVVEKWWTLVLWDSYHLVVGGENWWPTKSVRSGVTHYDETGAIVADHGTGSIFQLRNETTGALLDWGAAWHFQTDANGQVRVDIVQEQCRVRS